MADIISGGSRFTGDKKAPVRKVIKLNTDSSIGNNINNYDDRNIGQAAVTKEADYEEIRQRIVRHRIRMGLLIVLVIALIAGAVVLAMHLLDGYSYTSYSVTGSINREDTATSQYIATREDISSIAMMVYHTIQIRERLYGTRHIPCRSHR